MTERDPSFVFAPTSRRVLVWDFPTRFFHWALVLLMVVSIVTIKIGGNAMKFHAWSGYAILSLVSFRILWGVVGSHYSRFTTFLFGPRAVLDYVKGKAAYLGHNPLGAGSVFAMLGCIAFQAVSGLFANDDITFEGPLLRLVGKEWSDTMTGWHKFNEKILYALIALHLAAILFYTFKKKERLIGPMLSGYKTVAERVEEHAPVSTVLALILFAACGAGVAYVVR